MNICYYGYKYEYKGSYYLFALTKIIFTGFNILIKFEIIEG